ncbi:Myoinihitory peptide, partial [Frankliniella occidentalis]
MRWLALWAVASFTLQGFCLATDDTSSSAHDVVAPEDANHQLV